MTTRADILARLGIDIADDTTWPKRMTVAEVCACIRRSRRSLYDLIDGGKFPKADPGTTWHRDVVKRYVDGQIRKFEEDASKRERRGQLQVVGGSR